MCFSSILLFYRNLKAQDSKKNLIFVDIKVVIVHVGTNNQKRGSVHLQIGNLIFYCLLIKLLLKVLGIILPEVKFSYYVSTTLSSDLKTI